MGGMVPLGDASRRPRRIPFVTVLIILVNGFVFVLELTGGEAFVTRIIFGAAPPWFATRTYRAKALRTE